AGDHVGVPGGGGEAGSPLRAHHTWQSGATGRQAPDDQKPRQHLAAPTSAGAGIYILHRQTRRCGRGVRHAQAHDDGRARR
nr:hypothetical protein [Tanacetum cinerariifolium]